MTVLQPHLRDPAAPNRLSTVATPFPGRLRSHPAPRRHPLHEAVDVFAIALNRWLDRFAWARRLHRAHLARTEYRRVSLPVAANRAALDGLRIAFLTDLHAGAYLHTPELQELFDRVMEQKPDLICFGGDLVNTRAEEIELFDEPLRSLHAPLGVYAVAGNHDHRWTPEIGNWQDYLERRGVQVLANQGVRIERGDASMWLAGVDDLTDGQPDVRRSLWGRARNEPTLVLAHQPDHFPELAEHNVDLVLSGHTHGGQIKAFGWAPIAHTRHGYLDGGFACPHGGKSRLHVSRGVGVTILPFRVGARPEVTIVEVEAKPQR